MQLDHSLNYTDLLNYMYMEVQPNLRTKDTLGPTVGHKKKLTFRLRRTIVVRNDRFRIFLRLNDKRPFCFKIRMRKS